MVEKTPISLLQELSKSNGITPTFDLVGNEMQGTDQLFVFLCQAGEYSAQGKARSKREAKHKAASAVLREMGVNGESFKENPVEEEGSKPAKPESDGSNPVGEAQEYAQKHNLQPPEYTYGAESGPAHAREFSCTVKLGKFICTAAGKSKKVAKRTAALDLMNKIKEGGVASEEEAFGESQNDEFEEEEQYSQSITQHDDQVATNDTVLSRTVPDITFETKSSALEYARTILKRDGRDLINRVGAGEATFRELLEAVSEKQKFKLKFKEFPNKTKSGKDLVFIQVGSRPSITCQGLSSKCMDDAFNIAAHNALCHLHIVLPDARK